MMVELELTKTQEAFLDDLRDSKILIISMKSIQEKYSHIASKASIKRDIETLVVDGIIERNKMKTVGHNGRYLSSTSYKIK